MHIPADKRDKSASNGVGSRGITYGHKTSIPAGTFCLPYKSKTETGSTADITQFYPTMDYVVNLAKKTNQDIWVMTADAVYTSIKIIDYIENNNAIPFVDINPRNSKLLKKLKKAAGKLSKLSKKAIKKGLTLEERKAWVDDVQQFSAQKGGSVNINIKIMILRSILHKYEVKAIHNGLKGREIIKMMDLKKDILDIRKEIRKYGSQADKRIGISAIPHGTISWFLVYHIRGQNEGINGICKKKGNIIGDGQKTTWIIGSVVNHMHIQSYLFFVKYCALAYFIITGEKRHCMAQTHNWKKYAV